MDNSAAGVAAAKGKTPMLNPVGSKSSLNNDSTDNRRTMMQPERSGNTTGKVDMTTKKDVVLSSLAQQFSDSASRADAENAGLSRKELGAKAETLLNKITGPEYIANRAMYNAEIPDSSDPERLARAAQATKFVNGDGRNPFAGFTREQLALVTYDDSGIYTTNERRAAWEASTDQEYAWRKEVVAKAMAEYNSSGKLTNFFSAVLEHFKTLPDIEQAQYPDNYETKLQKWIELDYNYFTNTVEGKGNPADSISLQASLNIVNR